ncbi:MAG TPA: hypothetical protein VER08_07340 [Pyrinomonadaceae bacterium]|nr:hypothetical protein [Pyrinomonadaceae bacterium]
MNRQRLTVHARLTLTVLASSLLAAFTAYGQQTPQGKLLPGNWTFSAGPYSGGDAASLPVDVYSVTTEADKGLTATKVALYNRTSKDVTAVKLRWILTNGDTKSVLTQGDTSVVDINIAAGKRETLQYRVVSFVRIAKSLVGRSPLNGNYRLEILVSEATYADDSTWRLNESARKTKNRLRSRFHSASYPAGQSKCQSQGCMWNDSPDVMSYQCVQKADTFCVVSNNGRSCMETRCDGSPLPPVDESRRDAPRRTRPATARLR